MRRSDSQALTTRPVLGQSERRQWFAPGAKTLGMSMRQNPGYQCSFRSHKAPEKPKNPTFKKITSHIFPPGLSRSNNMAAPRIRAQIIFFIPTPATGKAAPRKKLVVAPEDRCRALTKLKNAADHKVPQCTRRKVPDPSKSRAQKSHRDIVAEELCNQHKLMLDRFSVSQASTDLQIV